MSVQIPNALLGVRRVEAAGHDAHGAEIPAAPAERGPLLPGKVSEGSGGQWQLVLDPGTWPVRTGDVVVSGDGLEWQVLTCQLVRSPSLDEVPGWAAEMDVSFVRVTAAQRTLRGTEPGGAEFVGR